MKLNSSVDIVFLVILLVSLQSGTEQPAYAEGLTIPAEPVALAEVAQEGSSGITSEGESTATTPAAQWSTPSAGPELNILPSELTANDTGSQDSSTERVVVNDFTSTAAPKNLQDVPKSASPKSKEPEPAQANSFNGTPSAPSSANLAADTVNDSLTSDAEHSSQKNINASSTNSTNPYTQMFVGNVPFKTSNGILILSANVSVSSISKFLSPSRNISSTLNNTAKDGIISISTTRDNRSNFTTNIYINNVIPAPKPTNTASNSTTESLELTVNNGSIANPEIRSMDIPIIFRPVMLTKQVTSNFMKRFSRILPPYPPLMFRPRIFYHVMLDMLCKFAPVACKHSLEKA